MHSKRAFTLIELLVVMAILAILAALILPVMSMRHGDRPHYLRCLNNLKQIDLAIHMYLDDQANGSPGNTNLAGAPFLSWTDYRELLNPYLNFKTPPSPQDRVFACPDDRFFYDFSGGGRGYVSQPLHEQTNQAFTSYAYNAGQFTTRAFTNALGELIPATTNLHGIAGRRLESIPHPTTTVLIAETPAYAPYSWHRPSKPFSQENSKFNDSRNILGFVDGHVEFTKMYYDGQKIAWSYNPPPGYRYQWSGD